MVELLVYLLLFAIVTALCASWLVRSWDMVIGYGSRCNGQISIHVAYDLLVRDLQGARAEKDQWLKITATDYVWRSGSNDVGWRVRDNKLMRIEGEYNLPNNSWGLNHHCQVAESVQRLTLTPHWVNGRVDQVGVSMERKKPDGHPYLLESMVAVRNRVVS